MYICIRVGGADVMIRQNAVCYLTQAGTTPWQKLGKHPDTAADRMYPSDSCHGTCTTIKLYELHANCINAVLGMLVLFGTISMVAVMMTS